MSGKPRVSWEVYALNLAIAAADRSEDPWVQVGAVVLRPDHSVASVGYNGAPPGVELDWDDRDRRRYRVIHAETNALRYCRTEEVRGGLLAVSHVPCSQCLVNSAAYGILEVVFCNQLENYPIEFTREIAESVGINLRHIRITNHKEKS